MYINLVFIHGLESTAQGTKGQFFRQNFPQMVIEDYLGDLDTRMSKLNSILAGKNNLVIVGSSFGGLMAAKFAMDHEDKMKKMVLIAPAINLTEFNPPPARKLQIPVIIYHGKEDTIVNPYLVKEIALKHFTNLEHHLVDDDHTLNNIFPYLAWSKILLSD